MFQVLQEGKDGSAVKQLIIAILLSWLLVVAVAVKGSSLPPRISSSDLFFGFVSGVTRLLMSRPLVQHGHSESLEQRIIHFLPPPKMESVSRDGGLM